MPGWGAHRFSSEIIENREVFQDFSHGAVAHVIFLIKCRLVNE